MKSTAQVCGLGSLSLLLLFMFTPTLYLCKSHYNFKIVRTLALFKALIDVYGKTLNMLRGLGTSANLLVFLGKAC